MIMVRLARLLAIVAVTVSTGCATTSHTPPGSMRTYLSRTMSDEDIESLRAAAPDLRIISGLSRAESLEIADEIDGMDGAYSTSEMLQAATRLTWVQAGSAGVERYLAVPELRDNDAIVFTNMQGVHGPTIADHVFGMLLTLTRDLAWYTDPAHRGQWNRQGSGAEPSAGSGARSPVAATASECACGRRVEAARGPRHTWTAREHRTSCPRCSGRPTSSCSASRSRRKPKA